MFAVLPRSLNLLSVGADAASTRGVDVGRTQRLAFLSASLATSAAVSLAGPIGFVGIVVPHLVRLMVGVDHRHRAAGIGALRRGIPRRLRSRGPDGARARRSAGRRRHRDAWRAVLSMAAGAGEADSPLRDRLLSPVRRESFGFACRGSRTSKVPPQPKVPRESCRSCLALTEMLFAVGAGPQVVGVSSYDDFPPETKSLPRVGALLDPDTERILSLRPDLVIVYGSQTELEGQFARAGIRVFAYRHSGVDNVLQTIRDVGSADGACGGRRPRRARPEVAARFHSCPVAGPAASANDARDRP